MLTVEEDRAIVEIDDKMIAYRDNPVGFLINVLGLPEEFVWSKMREVCNSVRDHQFTLVRACHSVSKTFTSGRLVPWFKMCFQPSTVITTAPSDNQVRNQLWREIHAAYAGSRIPLGGKMTTLMWDVKPNKDTLDMLPPIEREKWEKNFAIGFSTSPDTATEHATKMQGWHNEWVLFLFDEVCAIIPQIWRTVLDGLMIDDHCKLLAIGNPTDPECEFAKACYSSDPVKQEGSETYTSDMGYNVITISVYDTPNYKEDRRVIPGLAGREYVERIIKKYGPDGDGTRIRVKGLFPQYREGTYYGHQLATANREDRIGDLPAHWSPVKHTDPVRPTEPYSMSKVWAEAACRTYCDAHGLSVICLRIGWVNKENTASGTFSNSIWCSHHDIASSFEHALVKTNEPDVYDICYALSGVPHCWVDLDHARQVTGFVPRDGVL